MSVQNNQPDPNLPTIEFTNDFQTVLRGPSSMGQGKLQIVYDSSRLAVPATYGGFITYVRWNNDSSVFRKSIPGYSYYGSNAVLLFDMPDGSDTTVSIWFESIDKGGNIIGYDSNYGNNYVISL